jgi:murein L,D-transpeptidase YcbB/YkuD
VFQGWGDKAPEIEPKTVSWSQLNSDNFPYKLRQEKGPQNALGGIKFMFPNKFSVYLHDTPARGLFKRTKRDFSAGCIRIAKPIELAEHLLKDNLDWQRDKIRETISSGERKIVRLSNPIPVHILYLTSWVGIDGKVYFFSDVYDRDKAMMRALEERPPKA